MAWSPEEEQVRREEARTISRMLADRIVSVVGDLRLRGERQGNEFVALNPTRSDRSLGSFRITMSGPKAGVWIDHATGEAGDALSLVAYCEYRGRLADAIVWAKDKLDLPVDGPVPAARLRELPPPPDQAEIDAAAEKNRAGARAIWLAAEPVLRGTPVAAYLARRGLDLTRLRRQPRALRFHPKLKHVKTQAFYPAMVAAITDDAGEHISTHRTYLAEIDGVWRKAPLGRDAKMTLGGYAGGSIRIWRGASGKPLRDAPEGDQVGLFEGIETALSVAIACPELRILCAVAINNMRNIALPATVRTVFLGPDNDAVEGEAARKRHNLLAATIEHFRAGGRDVRLAMPDVPGADWNDILQGVEG